VAVEVHQVVNANRRHYVAIYPAGNVREIAHTLKSAKDRALVIAEDAVKSASARASARANARVDKFKLSTPLSAADWKFDSLLEGEHQIAWRWEAARQVRGSGKAWLDHSIKFRRETVQRLANNAQAPVREILGPVDRLPRDVPGAILLTLDIDCGFAAKDIAAWVTKRIASDPVFKSTPKPKAGNRHDYKTWLFQLAMVRLYHAGKTPEKIVAIAEKKWADRWKSPRTAPSPADIHSWIRETEQRLSKVKF
jgi:hypothetical protein